MNSYNLLPFYFDVVADKEVLVNEIGDMLIVPTGTVQNIVSREIMPGSDLYKTLHANFFISDGLLHPLFEVYASRLASKKAHLDNRASLHIFVVTLRCNQKCGYCQASSLGQDSLHRSMDIASMDKAVELMFQSNSENITMEFQGGEPTLEFPLLKYGIERAYQLNKRYNKNLSFVVCTNCIHLTDEFLSMCRDYDIKISSSLDGPKYIHDANRGCQGCYDRVIAGFKRVEAVLGADKLSALMTTSYLSLNHPQDIIDEYVRDGFTGIFLRALNPYGRAINTSWADYTEKFIKFYKTALEYIIELNQKGIYFREDYATLILRKILTSFDGGFVDLQSPAGCIQSVIVYNYDGYVYCSDESRMLAEEGKYYFQLGEITDKYEDLVYGVKSKDIARVSANECLAGCSQCAYKSYCGADPVRNFATQNDIYGNRPFSLFCKKNKAIISFLIELIITRKDTVLPIFKRWLR